MSEGLDTLADSCKVIAFPSGTDNPGQQEQPSQPVEEAGGQQIGGNPEPGLAVEPVILKPRTLLRENFLRLWRIGQQMGAEGIGLAMLCPECKNMIQLGLQGAQVVELRCACTVWSIRSIHI